MALGGSGWIRSTLALLALVLLLLPAAAEDSLIQEPWHRLRRIQAEHSPESGLFARGVRATAETGSVQAFRLRHPVHQGVDCQYLVREEEADSRVDGTSEHLASIGMGFSRSLKPMSLSGWLETGHRLQPGGDLRLQRDLREGIVAEVVLRGESMRDGLLPLHYAERREGGELNLSAESPGRAPLLAASLSWHRHRLLAVENAEGRETRLFLRSGLRFHPRPEREMGWEFYAPEFRFPGGVRQELLLHIDGEWRRYSSEAAYALAIVRPSRMMAATIGLELGVPISPRLGLGGSLEAGADPERDLGFGDILRWGASLRMVPTHRFSFGLQYASSSENAGAVRGEVATMDVFLQANL